MVRMKTIRLHGEYFIAVTIRLPHHEIHLITSTHGFISDAQFNTEFISNHHHQCAMAIVEHGDSFEELLTSRVISCSSAAASKGISEGMSGEEALFGMFA